MKRKAIRRIRKQLLRGLVLLVGLLILVYFNQPSQNKPEGKRSAPETQDLYSESKPSRPEASPKPKAISEKGPASLSFAIGHPNSFDEAKRTLRRLFPKGQDVYCSCSYDFRESKVVSLASCGLKPGPERRGRIEWEHVVPASVFGKEFPAWTEGDPLCQRGQKLLRGRNCAREASPDFRRMEADLYNLLPAIGELNQARSDLAYGDVPGEPRRFGPCDFEIKEGRVEPPAHIQGDVARIYFYMQARYPSFRIVHAGNRKVLEKWSAEDPIDQHESDRLARIEAVQGNSFFIGPLQPLRESSELETVQSRL